MKEFIEKLIGRLEEEKNKRLLFEDNATEEEAGWYFSGSRNGLADAIEIVNQLAEEYNNGWISVDVELPIENGKYLVYYHKWSDGNYLPKFNETEIRILRYRNNNWIFPAYGDTEAEKDSHREVIAWQPLPAPYQPKGE